jgi:hypothetical protein
MRQFQCTVLSKLSHDSLMGRAGKANVERPFAIGHLQSTVSLGN